MNRSLFTRLSIYTLMILLSVALYAEPSLDSVFRLTVDSHFGIDFDNAVSTGFYSSSLLTAGVIIQSGKKKDAGSYPESLKRYRGHTDAYDSTVNDIGFYPRGLSQYHGYIVVYGFEFSFGSPEYHYDDAESKTSELVDEGAYSFQFGWERIEARIKLANFYIDLQDGLFSFDKAHSFSLMEGSEHIFQRKQQALSDTESKRNLFIVDVPEESKTGFSVGAKLLNGAITAELGFRSPHALTKNIYNQYTLAVLYNHRVNKHFSYGVQTVLDINHINEYKEVSRETESYLNPVYKNLRNKYRFGYESRFLLPLTQKINLEFPVGIDFIFYEGKGFLSESEFFQGLDSDAQEIAAVKDRNFDIEVGMGVLFDWSKLGSKEQRRQTRFISKKGKVSSGFLFQLSYFRHYDRQQIIRTELQLYEDDGSSGLSNLFGFQAIALIDYYVATPHSITLDATEYNLSHTVDFALGMYVSSYLAKQKVYAGMTFTKYDLFGKLPLNTDFEKLSVVPALIQADEKSIPTRNIGQITLSAGFEIASFIKNSVIYFEYNSGNLLFEDLSKSQDPTVANLAASAARKKGDTNGLILDGRTFSQYGQLKAGVRIHF